MPDQTNLIGWVTAIAAVATVVIGAVAFIRSIMQDRNRKIMQHELVTSAPLLEIKDRELRARLQLYFDEKPITENVHLALIRLSIGNKDIEVEDFAEKPIKISFGSIAKIYAANIVESSNQALSPAITVDNTEVSILPTFWNRNEWIILRFLVGKSSPEPTIIGRIKGGEFVKLETPSNEGKANTRQILLGSLVIISGLLLIWFDYTDVILPGAWSFLPAVLIVVGLQAIFGKAN